MVSWKKQREGQRLPGEVLVSTGLLEVPLTSEASPVLFYEVWDWTEGRAKDDSVSSVICRNQVSPGIRVTAWTTDLRICCCPTGRALEQRGSVPRSLVSQETKEKLGNS